MQTSQAQSIDLRTSLPEAGSSGVGMQSDVRDMSGNKLRTRQLRAFFGKAEVLRGIDLEFPEKKVTAIIGPSGCGKSTFIRCLNRMHEVVPGAHAAGRVMLDKQNIYDRDVDPVRVRRRVGMVFQKANPFPTMSIRDNVLAGLRLNGLKVEDP